NKIHAAHDLDAIILEVSQDICALFEAEQLAIYVISEDKQSIFSKLRVGPQEFKDIKIAINTRSIVGYAALNKQTLNIADVYNDDELLKISPDIRFIKALDKQTGFRTKQMLVFPIIRPDNGRLIGVVQVINHTSGNDFPLVEEFVPELAETLAIAIRHRMAPIGMVKNKYGLLVHEGILSAEELESAQRSAGKSAKNLEDILIAEYQVKPVEIGRSLSAFFGVPLEIFKPDRIKPLDLLRRLKQSYVLSNAWIPIDETYEDGLVIMAPDPEMVKSSHIVSNIFPHYKKFSYRVCLYRDFANTVTQFYDTSKMSSNVAEILSSMTDADEANRSLPVEVTSAANDNELVKLVNKIIIDAHNQGASDIHIEPYPDKAKTLVRFRKDGTLFNYIEIPPSYRNSLIARIKIMCDLDISERRKPQDGKIQFKKFGPV
ncbi:MAG: ATPase, T2SS/T4P/T4SS family, partial [Nitrosomonadales bacterium]|nr:ATPase, T2SS/T4P/T4SS family [Nitrosomonadales bacterium]